MSHSKHFIFLAGHHKSGTSLLYRTIRSHPLISGFLHTGVPEDEGQHLQSVYKPAKAFGGPGRYIFDNRSYMNEHHELATALSARSIMQEWAPYFDASCDYYLEKSPPNLVRTRFLQALFPMSTFIVLLRHPIAIAYATRKWSDSPIDLLMEHTLRGFEIFSTDLPHLDSVYVLRYEDLTSNPQDMLAAICAQIGVSEHNFDATTIRSTNENYFAMWDHDRAREIDCLAPPSLQMEVRANKFGYSLIDYRKLLQSPMLGGHRKT